MTKEQIEARLTELRLQLLSLDGQAEARAYDIHRAQARLNDTTDLIAVYECELSMLEAALAKAIDAKLEDGYTLPQLKVTP